MRKPTTDDARLLIQLYELRRDPELRRARAWFLTRFAAQDWSEMQQRYLSHSDEDRWFRMVISYWEMVATLVNRGTLHDELFYDHTGEDVVTWERCKPWIAGARAAVRPSYLRQFERLVAGHQAYRERLHAAMKREAAPRARAARKPAPRKPAKRRR